MEDETLPTERDFDPHAGGLDEQRAWKDFGGLALEQARAKFFGDPWIYQEDFMFMGGKAFAYYYPIIEEYLKSVPEGLNHHDHCAWVLSYGIAYHFDGEDLPHVRHLAARIIALADFVRRNINRFGYDDEERTRVAHGWSELVRRVSSVQESK